MTILHFIRQVYLLDHLKKTCYHCGEDTGKPTITNQYLLCDVGLSKEWKNKPFTVIAEVGRGRRAKVGNTFQESVQEEMVLQKLITTKIKMMMHSMTM